VCTLDQSGFDGFYNAVRSYFAVQSNEFHAFLYDCLMQIPSVDGTNFEIPHFREGDQEISLQFVNPALRASQLGASAAPPMSNTVRVVGEGFHSSTSTTQQQKAKLLQRQANLLQALVLGTASSFHPAVLQALTVLRTAGSLHPANFSKTTACAFSQACPT
jgi:hypothetical protein